MTTASSQLASVDKSTANEPFELIGANAAMKSSIEKTFTVGKSVTWGVLMKDVDPSSVASEATRASMRKTAGERLMNIGISERDRRKLAGTVGAVLSAGIYVGMLYFHVGLLSRIVGLYFPIAFSVGFLKSGQEGL